MTVRAVANRAGALSSVPFDDEALREEELRVGSRGPANLTLG